VSVLQDMTKDIMTTKATRSQKLTAVAGESGMTVASVALTLPNDVGVFMSNEALIDHAQALRKFAADAIAIADGLDAMAAGPNLPPSLPVIDEKAAAINAKKAAEQEGDRKAAASKADDGSEAFKERLDRLSAEAQAAVFTAADDDGTQPESPFNSLPHELPVTDGWTCPEHGSKDLSTITPRKGDPYRMCGVGDCEYFEK
jgi:hypothetical protein